ncbi:MAG: hypothetical protein KatS3mg008_1903 [Acidimicrobiales bacterium]|nr:MAG: hypothetical protein KatS3mg008_1903 [Acidimicrobiales bacterium]
MTIDGLRSPTFEVTMLLADAAQVADRKLYILGGGVSLVGPAPTPMALAILIRVPWDRANEVHDWKVELLDEDFSPVMANDRPVLVGGTFEAGRPPGLQPGTPLDVPLAINFGPVALPPGRRYTWRFSIDDTSEEGWRVSFSVREAS